MKKLCFVISAALLSSHAFADAGNTYIRNGNVYSHQGQYFAGAGVITGSKFYKGQDHQTGAYLNGGYHGEDFNADLAGINYRFFGDNDSAVNFSAFLVANPGFDSDDADILSGMKDRDISGDLGLNADLHLGQGTLSSKFQHDVTGVYKGYQADLTYYHPMNLGFADFVPYAGVHYFSKDYVNYYTGVSRSEAKVHRPAYQSSGAFSYNVGYALVIPVTKHLDITQSTGYSRLGSNMGDSPLVNSNNQWATSLGVNYSF
ncbi:MULTISPECIES: outer membrane protein OmpV [Ferrimonas]|uniref:outer membrane protein OmpV n=1 Tax=Ferrimonas TaxID=44011 RepID=UPI0004060CE1|nr:MULTISPECIES: MipA/OmpV family protein [Ferrimonas]USD37548.1 MipA/OmpV family protein [Ferrimonas sp. SCSIO 43195]